MFLRPGNNPREGKPIHVYVLAAVMVAWGLQGCGGQKSKSSKPVPQTAQQARTQTNGGNGASQGTAEDEEEDKKSNGAKSNAKPKKPSPAKDDEELDDQFGSAEIAEILKRYGISQSEAQALKSIGCDMSPTELARLAQFASRFGSQRSGRGSGRSNQLSGGRGIGGLSSDDIDALKGLAESLSGSPDRIRALQDALCRSPSSPSTKPSSTKSSDKSDDDDDSI